LRATDGKPHEHPSAAAALGTPHGRAESRPGHGPGRRCTHLPDMRFPASSSSSLSSTFPAASHRSDKVELEACLRNENTLLTRTLARRPASPAKSGHVVRNRRAAAFPLALDVQATAHSCWCQCNALTSRLARPCAGSVASTSRRTASPRTSPKSTLAPNRSTCRPGSCGGAPPPTSARRIASRAAAIDDRQERSTKRTPRVFTLRPLRLPGRSSLEGHRANGAGPLRSVVTFSRRGAA
jgi:hypothetical protein